MACARRLPQVPCSHSGPERSQQQAPSTPSAILVVLGVSLRGSQGAMGRDGSTAHTRTAETRAPVPRCTSRYQRQDKAEETCGHCHPSGPGGARSDSEQVASLVGPEAQSAHLHVAGRAL